MFSRRNLFYFLGLILVFWTVGPLLVWVMDPYHLFHETRWNKDLWFGSQILMNLGQIESYLKKTDGYDGILVGSSHTMNFKGSDLAKAVGAKGVLKLCSGYQYFEEGVAYISDCVRSGKLSYCFAEINVFLETYQLVPRIPKHGGMQILKSLKFLIGHYFIPSRLFSKNDDRFWTWTDLNSIHSWFPYRSDRFQLWIQASNLAQLKKGTPDFSDWRIAQRLNDSTTQRLNDSTTLYCASYEKIHQSSFIYFSLQ